MGTGLLLCYLLWAHVRGDLSLYILPHKRTESIGLWFLCFFFFLFLFFILVGNWNRWERLKELETEHVIIPKPWLSQQNFLWLLWSRTDKRLLYFISDITWFWWVVCSLAHCSWGALQFLVKSAFSLVWTHCWELLHPLLCWGRGREIKAMCRRDFNHHVAN